MQYPPQQPPSQFPSQPQWAPQQQWQQPPFQPSYPLHQEHNSGPSWPPPQPVKKAPSPKDVWFGCGVLIALIIIIGAIIGGIVQAASSTPSSDTSSTQATAQPTTVPTPTPTLAPTPTPTPKPAPTMSPAQLEHIYKISATSTTVAALDKDGNADQDHIVHFTCTIFGFVKDSSGNTAGANVDDPNTSGVIQVAFPSGTDLSQLNTGDTLEVWGIDGGTSTGQNAFGATIQEVGVAAQYMTDQTTGYSTP